MFFSYLNYDCSDFLNLRNLQGQVKKALCYQNCFDLSLLEKIVLVISNFLQILCLQPRISKVFLDHWCWWLQRYSNSDATLLRRWIQFNPIVNPLLHLISFYLYYRITIYKLDVTSWSVWTTLSSRPRVLRFYTCLLQGVYIASHSDSDCSHLHSLSISH